MNNIKNINKAILILLGIVIYNNGVCQKDTLQIFETFVGHKWIGHYINSDDSALVHYITWEYCLDSNYVKQIKEVPEVGFKMESYFYWDYEKKQISSLSLLNKEILSKGRVQHNKEKLEIYERTFFGEGYSDSKKTFEITEAGNLKDCFYRKKSNKWIQRHLIIYKKL